MTLISSYFEEQKADSLFGTLFFSQIAQFNPGPPRENFVHTIGSIFTMNSLVTYHKYYNE